MKPLNIGAGCCSVLFAHKELTLKIISVFNNKGGVGKTTLTFHVAHALATLQKKVLIIDADPQCNLTIYGIDQEKIHDIWKDEDEFIDFGFDSTNKKMSSDEIKNFNSTPRSIHYLLKPTEEGTGDSEHLPPPLELNKFLHLVPGRLSLHLFEEKIAQRWTDTYRGDPLSIRTVTKIRSLAETYSKKYNYDIVIIDTSPSLGSLNKVIISTVDGFFIPTFPDLFSLYGIKNIGKSLSKWKEEFDIIYKLISDDKRKLFPSCFVRFMGYTIYNARPYSGVNDWDLAQGHMNYAKEIPGYIKNNISKEIMSVVSGEIDKPIGMKAVMHTHNTFPSMAQYYHKPMWEVPSHDKIEQEHRSTLAGSRSKYEGTKEKYQEFAKDLLSRIASLESK
ncbi:MAG: ParA family protein [Magnetococcus sp. YQC-3]